MSRGDVWSRWSRGLGAGAAALLLSACAGGPASAPTAQPTLAPTPVATVARAAASPAPSPSPRPTDTPEAAAHATTVYVDNTDGEGVFVRRTPAMADRVRAYADGTALTVVGDDVDGDGQHWKHIKTPDDLEGYVPSIYTVDTPP